jgi:hypothetical protein
MQTFKEFYEKPVFGANELIEIDGLGKIKAKIDSGNEAYNVIHGVDVSEEGENVSFTTVDGKRLTKPRKGEIKIHIGSGVKEDRPIVLMDISINGKNYKSVPFSIADRSENEDPILVGEPFLKKLNALIDVNKPVHESVKYKVVAINKNDKLANDWKLGNYSENLIRRIANKQKTLIVNKQGSPKFKGNDILKIFNPETKKPFIVFKKKSKASEADTTQN